MTQMKRCFEEYITHLKDKQGFWIAAPSSKQMNNWTHSKTPVRTKYNAGFLPILSTSNTLVRIY